MACSIKLIGCIFELLLGCVRKEDTVQIDTARMEVIAYFWRKIILRWKTRRGSE
jgi:hypothetical protein